MPTKPCDGAAALATRSAARRGRAASPRLAADAISPAPRSRSARFEDDDEAARFAAPARAAGVPVNVIDKPAFCDFSFGAIVNRSPLVIGISTDGAAPVFGQAIRAKLEAHDPARLRALGRGRAALARRACRHRACRSRARRRFWQLFTARAVAQPGPRAGGSRFRRAAGRDAGRSATRRRRARSRWSAPARAIRNC